MKLPEPAARQYQSRDGEWCDFINTKHYMDTAADGTWPIRALYSEAQVKELLAQADKDASDLMLIVHMKQAAKYDPVLKQALEALWTTATPKCEDAIKAIQEVLA